MGWISDFNQAHFDIRVSPTMDGETHDNCRERCHCRRRRVIIDDVYFYIYYRFCFCGLKDRSQLFDDTPNDKCIKNIPKNRDGIDIHENSACKYQKVKRGHNKRKFKLECHCIRGQGNIRI